MKKERCRAEHRLNETHKKARRAGNAVHLSGAALRLTGYRVFDIFTALGLAGLGRFVMKSTPMLRRFSR
ncbi:hypothetical protein [Pseudomonas syringae]|uniref:hypothetical protein n=3 Tax=Pseudomonas syringae TaxID=317 RepID=UPI0012BA6B66|nr:hypothetical protein [Pseudomonas syringae]